MRTTLPKANHHDLGDDSDILADFTEDYFDNITVPDNDVVTGVYPHMLIIRGLSTEGPPTMPLIQGPHWMVRVREFGVLDGTLIIEIEVHFDGKISARSDKEHVEPGFTKDEALSVADSVSKQLASGGGRRWRGWVTEHHVVEMPEGATFDTAKALLVDLATKRRHGCD